MMSQLYSDKNFKSAKIDIKQKLSVNDDSFVDYHVQAKKQKKVKWWIVISGLVIAILTLFIIYSRGIDAEKPISDLTIQPTAQLSIPLFVDSSHIQVVNSTPQVLRMVEFAVNQQTVMTTSKIISPDQKISVAIKVYNEMKQLIPNDKLSCNWSFFPKTSNAMSIIRQSRDCQIYYALDKALDYQTLIVKVEGQDGHLIISSVTEALTIINQEHVINEENP
ncbi:hypothetical protein QUF63_03515 [Anaerolineales bacterium HSG25]|nr:hypothetical protein [Anaerolineales bacterium HSG25]